ncbi:MAG TPA: YigZ family protein [Clostridiaceae bacterium]|nr:YigZ family protein [Clostridiaceae bacterium]
MTGIQMQYKTISKEATVEMEEKKSRFIANVKPVSSEEEALEFINNIRAKYWDATHNVYAYYISGESIIQRFSDDGEPSGTAGMPVLEVIKRMELKDLVVVVTRYFGGILLGASGLVRAYSKSAALGIEAAGIVTKKLCRLINIVVDYSAFGKIQNKIMNEGYSIKDIQYAQDVEISVLIPLEDVNAFIEYVNDAANGNVLIDMGESEYVTLKFE